MDEEDSKGQAVRRRRCLDGVAKDRQRVPKAAIQTLPFLGELGRWCQIAVEEGVRDGHGKLEASLAGKLGDIDEDAISEGLDRKSVV